MIKFRQKDFSKNKVAEIIFRGKLIGNKTATAAKKAISGLGKAEAAKKNIKLVTDAPIKPKSRYDVARESIKASKKVRSEAFNVASNPGNAASRAVGFVAENPIAGTLIPAGYAVMVPGTTMVATGTEALVKKAPIYKKATQTIGKLYKTSKLPGIVETGTNALVNSAKIMSGVPIS